MIEIEHSGESLHGTPGQERIDPRSFAEHSARIEPALLRPLRKRWQPRSLTRGSSVNLTVGMEMKNDGKSGAFRCEVI